jgi:NAD(P)-dependent dehydrogenase (short-subunit alcohol dehydrogenase family)
MAGVLAGKTALVTGASKGIGAAVAQRLANDGARVLMLARGREALEQQAAAIGRSAVPIVCDVADPAEVQGLASRCATELGMPDIVVNNAGIFEIAYMHEMSVDMFTRMIQINLVGPFHIVHAFLPSMRERGRGHIVTIGSTSDRNIHPENGAYSAAKFGLRGMHEVLRAELRGTGVRTTLVSPSAVDTPIWNPLSPGEGERRFPPRERMLRPEDVANAVAYVVTQPEVVNIDELRLSHS